jgi:hypothetical protein
MSRRREFSRKVKAEIKARATNAAGVVCCEGCGLVLGKKPYQIDHTIAEELVVDKSRKLTAADGKLLGQECCHGPKTGKHDAPVIAEAKRREAKDGGFAPAPTVKIQSAPFRKSQRAAARQAKPSLPPRVLFGAPSRLWPASRSGEIDD